MAHKFYLVVVEVPYEVTISFEAVAKATARYLLQDRKDFVDDSKPCKVMEVEEYCFETVNDMLKAADAVGRAYNMTRVAHKQMNEPHRVFLLRDAEGYNLNQQLEILNTKLERKTAKKTAKKQEKLKKKIKKMERKSEKMLKD